MSEKMRFRIGFMEWPWFSKGDSVNFHVMMKDRGSIEIPVDYVEAATAEEAKKKLYAIIDRMFDHREHMEVLERLGAASKQRHQELVRDLREVQSLTIGSDTPAVPTAPPARQSDLIDLCGDVLGDNGTGKNNA